MTGVNGTSYGGFWIRFVAYLVDTFMLFVALFVLAIGCAFLGQPVAQAIAAPAPVAATAAPKPAAPVPSTPQPERPVAVEVVKVAAPAPGKTAAGARSRANEDARSCLNLSGDVAIVRCAEKFR